MDGWVVNCREGETFVLVLSLPGVTGHQRRCWFATCGLRHTTGLQNKSEDCRGYHWVGQHKTQKMIQKNIQIKQLHASYSHKGRAHALFEGIQVKSIAKHCYKRHLETFLWLKRKMVKINKSSLGLEASSFIPTSAMYQFMVTYYNDRIKASTNNYFINWSMSRSIDYSPTHKHLLVNCQKIVKDALLHNCQEWQRKASILTFRTPTIFCMKQDWNDYLIIKIVDA